MKNNCLKSINFLIKGGGEITIIIQGDFSDFYIIFTTAPLQNSQNTNVSL